MKIAFAVLCALAMTILSGCITASTSVAPSTQAINQSEFRKPQKLEEAIAHFEKNNLQGHEYVYLDSAEYCGNCVRVVLVRLGKTTPEWKQESQMIEPKLYYAKQANDISMKATTASGNRFTLLHQPWPKRNPYAMVTYPTNIFLDGQLRDFSWTTYEFKLCMRSQEPVRRVTIDKEDLAEFVRLRYDLPQPVDRMPVIADDLTVEATMFELCK